MLNKTVLVTPIHIYKKYVSYTAFDYPLGSGDDNYNKTINISQYSTVRRVCLVTNILSCMLLYVVRSYCD